MKKLRKKWKFYKTERKKKNYNTYKLELERKKQTLKLWQNAIDKIIYIFILL